MTSTGFQGNKVWCVAQSVVYPSSNYLGMNHDWVELECEVL